MEGVDGTMIALQQTQSPTLTTKVFQCIEEGNTLILELSHTIVECFLIGMVT